MSGGLLLFDSVWKKFRRGGDPVFIIVSQSVGDRSADLQSLEAEIQGAAGSLANKKKEYESQRLAAEEEDRRLVERVSYLRRAIEFEKEQLSLTKEVAEKYKQLYESGLTNWAEYAIRKLEVNKVAVDLAQLETEQKENTTAREKLRHQSEARDAEYRELERSLTEDMEKGRIRVAALKKDLVASIGNELSVAAPCSGVVLRLRVKAAGAVVRAGEVLCELACAGDGLQAELTVPQSGVGLIKPGQAAKLLYDAFPYQRYGVRYGTVRWVSPATVVAESGPVFHALADIEDEAILAKGQPRPLREGMGGTAHVVVGRRRLITYAFEPIRQLKESLSDAPARAVPEDKKQP